ncbi:hypothetical protein ACWOFR_07185 [Carnobacterium gallinarum]|uniref:hypothetical protein n=1 Tax=Carnobacterium gallinarum TaxID=2749 RepID=UPI0005594B60|nr:hypothetical protein [Carnobacterium gallinarum]
MKYKLSLNEIEVMNWDESVLIASIKELKNEDFIVIETEPPLNNSTFLQTMYDEGEYTVEIRYELEEDFKQYSIVVKDIDMVIELFKEYYNQELPNISSWEDISAYMKTYIERECMGVTKEMSHPTFLECFQDDIYYSQECEEGPFGSDTGFDVFNYIQNEIRKDEDCENEEEYDWDDYPKSLMESLFKEEYIEPSTEVSDEDLKIKKEIYYSSQVCISVAFTLIKVYGELSEELMKQCILAVERLNYYYRLSNGTSNVKFVKMLDDLHTFTE